MKKIIENIVKLFIYTSFFVPLAVFTSQFIFPFIVPKILLFRSLVLLMAGGCALLWLGGRKITKAFFSPLNITVFIFLLSLFISTFVGVDWYKSLWDNHERMLGLFTLIHFILYYFILGIVAKEWKDWRWFLWGFLFAGCLVMLLGLAQKFNPYFLFNNGGLRVHSTLGNPIYYSGYALFLTCIGLLLFWMERGWTKWLAFAGMALAAAGIFWGGTRGTFLGLVAAVCMLLVICLFDSSYRRLKLFAIIALLMICLVGGGLFILREKSFVRDMPIIGSLLNIDVRQGTAQTRLMAWGIAINAWKEKPIFGWGPNNYYYAFNKYYRSEFLEHGYSETWFDNAHGVIFNTLAVQGVVGLLSYLSLFAAPIFLLWRGHRRKQLCLPIFAVGNAFLVGHFIHNAFVFENPTSYLYFFFFLAFINSQITDNNSQIIDKKFGDNNGISISLVILAALVVILLIYSTNINPARANMGTLRTIKSMYSQPLKSEDVFTKFISSAASPHIDDIRFDLTRAACDILPSLAKSGRKAEAERLSNLVNTELKKNLIIHPLDIRTNLTMVNLIFVGSANGFGANKLQEADALMTDALSKSPKRQQIIYQLSALKAQLGDFSGAILLLQASIKDDPKISDGWWRLAWTYQISGDTKKAKETMQNAQESGVVFTVEEMNKIKSFLPEFFITSAK